MSAGSRLPRQADDLLLVLATETVEPLAPGEARELRTRVVERINGLRERAMTRRRGPARWARRVVLVLAACVPLAIGWGASRRSGWSEGSAQVVALAGTSAIERDGARRTLPTSGSTALDERDDLRTGPNGLVRASLPTGAVVKVGPRSSLRFVKAGERGRGPLRDRIELLTGKIDVQVPKLVGENEVTVYSGGATVVVHGTKFSVEHQDASETSAGETRIEVTEGKVAVYFGEQEHILTSGASLVVPFVPAAPAPSGEAARVGQPASTATARGAAGTDSTLAAENGLLSDAMRMRREGDGAGAIAAIDELLAGYPGSPLTETARVEKVRALTETGSLRAARREAERYLADFPHGFAREEALRVLGAPRAHAK